MPGPDTTVLFVKKVQSDGEPCAKCRDVEQRLHRDGLMKRVNQVITAVDDDPESPGMKLAARLDVQRAPFFVLRWPDGKEQVVESYLAFKRRFTAGEASTEELTDAVDRHPDLAFI